MMTRSFESAFTQLGPSVVSPGLRERVLDQLSMHFQLLVQTSVFAAKVGLLNYVYLGGGVCSVTPMVSL